MVREEWQQYRCKVFEELSCVSVKSVMKEMFLKKIQKKKIEQKLYPVSFWSGRVKPSSQCCTHLRVHIMAS